MLHRHVTDARARSASSPATLDLGQPVLHIDAHRRLRGPYTLAGGIVRALVPSLLPAAPDLVAAHDVEILTVAPELDGLVTNRRGTVTSMAPTEERTRFYPRARTRRVAHGIVELLSQAADPARPATIVVAHAEHADPTDLEFLVIALRRLDPRRVRLVVVTGPGAVIDPGLAQALGLFAEAVTVAGGHEDAALADADAAAREFLRGDGVSEDSRLAAAYAAAWERDEPVVRSWHDERAGELIARGEMSLHLGAIAWHRERGSDRAAATETLRRGLEHCVLMGFYDAVLDLGERCLALLDFDAEPAECWLVIAKLTTALTALDRPEEAARWYDEACARTTLPSVHMAAAYGRAMLLTRFFDKTQQDHRRAKGHINTAVAMCSLLPEGERRAFNLTFNENGLALIEMHLGDWDEALRLVTAGLDRLDAELDPTDHTLHRSVLRYNRAQLLAGRARTPGQLAAAVAEYDSVIEIDPHHSEYRLERASLLRRQGRVAEALRDLEAAARYSPPFPEPYYNRADLLVELGEPEQAIADLDYVLELEPEMVDAYVNRAAALLSVADVDAAAADVAAGLRLAATNPLLHALAGCIASERGDVAAARGAFDLALSLNPDDTATLANRAVLAYEAGDPEGALADLDRALAIVDDPDLRSNRAIALEALHRWREAAEEWTAILEHADDAQAAARLADCMARVA